MRAEQTAVHNLISVELCADCPLREGHVAEPDYLENSGKSVSGMRTEVYVLSKGQTTGVVVDGIRSNPALIEAFENCQGPTQHKSIFISRKLGCSAVESLRK